MSELTVPQVDFSALGQLPGIYKQGQADALRQQTLANLGQGGTADANALLRSGDLSLAQLGINLQNRTADQERQARQDTFQREESARAQRNADRSYGLQARASARADEGPIEQAGYRAKVAQQYGLDPNTPEGRAFVISGKIPDSVMGNDAASTATQRASLAKQYGIDPATPEGRSFVLTGKLPDMSAPSNYEPNPDFGKVEGASKLRPISGGPADPASKSGGLLDDDTIKAMAKQARAGDTSIYQNLGRGQQGAENIVRLRQEVSRQNAEAGVSGEEQALRNAEMAGVKAGQRTIGTKGANIEMAATEFNQVLPVVQKASQSVSRTNYPDLNKVILAYQQKTGDPNVVAFGGAVNTLVNLYSRAISPTGNPTVSDKEHAREILAASWAQGQFDAAVGMMKKEIDAALQSPEKVRDEMRSRFLKGQGAAPVGYPAPGDNTTRPAPVKIDGYTITEH